MSQPSTQDIDQLWDELTTPCLRKLSQHQGQWEALSPDEQNLAALWKLEADMYNGGFVQFFCNWGYECYGYATRGLAHIGAQQGLALVKQAYQVIEHLGEDERLSELWDIPRFLTAAEAAQLNELDRRYWEDADQVAAKTVAAYLHRRSTGA
ncbi:hypothetical protein GCM10027048_29260 [Hymenobacter coalescens]